MNKYNQLGTSMPKDWRELLQQEFDSPNFNTIIHFLNESSIKGDLIFPPYDDIFTAFRLTAFLNTKVVVIGQDPYHGKGQAHGLCFSVQTGISSPPSLINIFKEIQLDIGYPIPSNGNLENWAKQGVLMINAILTVKAHEPGSHQKSGWQWFTDAVIKKISDKCEGIVFLLWGKHAESKETLIDQNKHFVLKAAHPSPYSASNGFFGCRHFSKTNEILKSIGRKPIDWRL